MINVITAGTNAYTKVIADLLSSTASPIAPGSDEGGLPDERV
jgi:hypothetical protein